MSFIRFLRFALSVLLVSVSLSAFAATDFAVENVSLSSNSAAAGSHVTVTTTVRNVSGDTGMVIVYVYLSADSEITADDTRLNFSYIVSLAAGNSASTAVTVALPANLATGTYYLGSMAQAATPPDPNPANDTGAAAIAVSGVSCEPDSFEPDDTVAQARPIALNTTQTHNHCDDPHDWFSFSAIAGATYGLQTRAISYNYSGAALILYDGDGKTVLAKAPTGTTSGNPKIVWTAPASGIYYVQARSWLGFNSTGANTTYAFSFADNLAELEITNFQSEPLSVNAGGTAQVYAAIANRGFAAAGPFKYALYLSTDPTVTRTDRRIGYLRFDSIPAHSDGHLAWTLAAFPSDLPAGTYYLAGIVDDRDQVTEYHEDNNTSPVVIVNVSGLPCQIDAYEDDDLHDQARLITPNEHQVRNHCEDAYDWVYIDAFGGTKYFLRALYPDGRVDNDRLFEIYDANHKTVASGGGLLGWTPALSGRYHILVWSYGHWTRPGSYIFGVLQELPDLVAETPYAIDNWGFVPRGGLLDLTAHRVQNLGYADSTPTQLRYYLSPDDRITTVDRVVAEFNVPALPVGTAIDALEQMISIPRDQPLGVNYLGVIVDPAGAMPDLNRSNNADSSPYYLEIVDPVCPPDVHDDDDHPAQARPIGVGETQSRNFCDDGYDWLRFDAQPGATYAFEGTDVGVYVDVQLAIYDVDGKTVLATGERSTVLGDPYRNWVALTAPAAGTYYLRTTSKGSAHAYAPYGNDLAYTVKLGSCLIDAFEQDDDATQGRGLALGDSQARNHCDDGVDWVTLSVPAAGSYTISTGNLETNADTALELYDGATLLAGNDNVSRNNPASRVTYSFTQPGTYYLRVSGKNRGAGTGYTLTFQPAKGGK